MQTHVHSGALFGIDALPPDALVSAVHEETEGNPFFVTEVVRLLASDGRLERADDVRSWTFAIPQGVREVLGRRLDRLSPDCNQVLTMASVIGREFSLESLGRVSNVPRVRLLTLLEEAVDARVIDPIAPVAGRFSFAHRLVRETLYDELTAAHRITLHRRVGEVIESTLCIVPPYGQRRARGFVPVGARSSERDQCSGIGLDVDQRGVDAE